MAIKRRIRREPLRFPEIIVTPLVDVALTLLIIFMVTAPMMKMSIKIDLPDSKTAQTTKVEEESIVVEMDTTGAIHFGKKVYDITLNNNALTTFKHDIAHRVTRTNNVVFLFADRTLRYQRIVDLFDILNAIDGVRNVSLVTQRPT